MAENEEDLGPEMRRLVDRLFGDPKRKLKNINVWWGEDAHLLTAEERARALNDAFDDVETGKSAPYIPLSGPKMSVNDFLATLTDEQKKLAREYRGDDTHGA